MPAHTYQIAIQNEGKWLREYVCAESRDTAVQVFLDENPPLTLDFLAGSQQFEVERCE